MLRALVEPLMVPHHKPLVLRMVPRNQPLQGLQVPEDNRPPEDGGHKGQGDNRKKGPLHHKKGSLHRKGPLMEESPQELVERPQAGLRRNNRQPGYGQPHVLQALT